VRTDTAHRVQSVFRIGWFRALVRQPNQVSGKRALFGTAMRLYLLGKFKFRE
jgi:hypothetical protein